MKPLHEEIADTHQKMADEIDRLRSVNTEMRAVLQAFLDYGDARVHRDKARAILDKIDASCPLCGGDCSAANPPVMNCPRETR